MSDEYGNDFVSISDEDGNEFELEHIDTIEHNGETYMAFLPADLDEDSEDFGMIILKVITENGEEILATPDSEEEAEQVYDKVMERLYAEESELGGE